MSMDAFSVNHKIETVIRFDGRRTAVLVIDMLNDFCKPGGAMVLSGYERLVAPQRAILLGGYRRDPRPQIPLLGRIRVTS